MTEEVRYAYRSPSIAAFFDALEIAKWSARRVLYRQEKRLPDTFKRRVIASYARRYNLQTFVESGTYLGRTVAFMKRYCRHVYSIEFQDHLARAAQARFAADPGIQIFHGSGATWIPRIVANLREPALFWLDGHFAAGTAHDGEVACPTLDELSAVLADSRYNHVILIDDAREFRGIDGYPTLEAVQQFIRSSRSDVAIEVNNDIVRVIPERARQVSAYS
jgi:hypothetical protein